MGWISEAKNTRQKELHTNKEILNKNIIFLYNMTEINWATTKQDSPYFLAVNGDYLYVSTNNTYSSVQPINLATPSSSENAIDIPNPQGQPQGITIDENGILYAASVSNTNNTTIYQINLADSTQSTFLTLNNTSIFGMATFGGKLYAINSLTSNSEIFVINISSKNIQTTITSPQFNYANSLAIDSTGTYMYVANTGANTISRITLSTHSVENTIWCSFEYNYNPFGLAIYGDYLYASIFLINESTPGNTILQINLSNAIVKYNWFDGLSSPQGLCAFDSFLYVANGGNQTISKIELPPLPPTPPPVPPTPISNICFPAKTPITTDQGIISIEDIDPDVHTIRNKKIVAITKTISLDDYLICIEKDAIDLNYPNETTLISKDHKIFYEGQMIRAETFVEEFEDVYRIEYNGEILYNVLMEHHNKMCVNNLICETLHQKNIIAKLYSNRLDESCKNRFIESLNIFFTKSKQFKKKDSNDLDIMNSEEDLGHMVESLDDENYNKLVKYLNSEINKKLSLHCDLKKVPSKKRNNIKMNFETKYPNNFSNQKDIQFFDLFSKYKNKNKN